MMNKFKSPTALILIFLLNGLSLSACTPTNNVSRSLVSNNSQKVKDVASSIIRKTVKKTPPIKTLPLTAVIKPKKWVEQKANQYAPTPEEIDAARNSYGELPENFFTNNQQRITQKIIDEANKMGQMGNYIKNISVNSIVGAVLTTKIMTAQPTKPIEKSTEQEASKMAKESEGEPQDILTSHHRKKTASRGGNIKSRY